MDPWRLSEIATRDEMSMHFCKPKRCQTNGKKKKTSKFMYMNIFNSKGPLAQIPCQSNETINSDFYTKEVLPEVIRSIDFQWPVASKSSKTKLLLPKMTTKWPSGHIYPDLQNVCGERRRILWTTKETFDWYICFKSILNNYYFVKKLLAWCVPKVNMTFE